MKIIGLTGKAGAGKDTACQYILDWCDRNGIEARRDAYADRLKLSAARSLGLTVGEPLEKAVQFCNELKTHGSITVTLDPKFPHREYTISGREFLQWYGTEAHRDVFGESFWVDAVFRAIDWPDVLVITDVRFDNEARAILNGDDPTGEGGWLGEVWEVARPDAEEVAAHSSEDGLSEGLIEFELLNTGDLVDLQNLVEAACESNIA